MVEKILNNTTPYGKIRASHEGSLHSSTSNENAVSHITKCLVQSMILCLTLIIEVNNMYD